MNKVAEANGIPNRTAVASCARKASGQYEGPVEDCSNGDMGVSLLRQSMRDSRNDNVT